MAGKGSRLIRRSGIWTMDFRQSRTFHEMESEEQITMMRAKLPDEVIEAIEDFEITHTQ